MCVVIDSRVIISNACYAYLNKHANGEIIKYKYIEEFKRTLYQKITESREYVMFLGDDSNLIDIDKHVFVKEREGIWCVNKLDDSFINGVNSIFPQEIKGIIEKTREEILI